MGGRRRGGSVATAALPAHLLLGLGLLASRKTRVACFGELVLEFLNAASGVDELQLACKEGVASVADIDLEFFPGAARDKRIAAAAGNFGFVIIWVGVFFHGFIS